MTIIERLKASKGYFLDLLTEMSTWRAIMFFVSFIASKYGYDLSDENAVVISTTMSYTIGILFKDDFLKKKKEGQ